MATINLTLDHTLVNGEAVIFKAPCDCTAVSGITITHPVSTEDGFTYQVLSFSFRDAHNNDLSGLGNLFAEGAAVKVILNTDDGFAYIQNADTNAYLEGQLNGKSLKSTLVTATLTASEWSGSSAPYTMTVSVAGVTATSAVELLPGVSVTAAQLVALQSANIQGGTQSAGSIQLKAFGAKPSINLPVRFIVRGDL